MGILIDDTNTLFCTNCGRKVNPAWKYCAVCGALVVHPEPEDDFSGCDDIPPYRPSGRNTEPNDQQILYGCPNPDPLQFGAVRARRETGVTDYHA